MLAAFLSLVLVMAGCSDSTDPKPNPMVGQWIGTYGSGTATTPNDYTFIFFANGTMQAIDGLPPFDESTGATGVWERVGNTVNGTYQYAGDGGTYSFTGTLSAPTPVTGTTLTGMWGSGTTTGDGGFVVEKQ
jgi:hypothetical protein